MNKLKRLNLNRKRILTISMISFISFALFFPLSPLAGLGDILEDAVASLIIIIGDGIQLIVTEMESGLDKLVYNVDGDFASGSTLANMNLSLLRGTTLSTNLFKIYDIFYIIACCFMCPIAIWTTIDFIKTGDDPNHKVKLKERLTKLVISFFLLSSLPIFMDIMLVVNQAILDTFRAFINSDVLSSGGSGVTDMSKPFLMDIFRDMAEGTGTFTGSIPLSLVYLIAGFLNVWMVVFYIIRDLTISFLFILAPPIMILLAYRTDLVVKWFKEMASNIFTQAIHGVILAVLMAIAATLSTEGEVDLYSSIFCLVAFAMFIPLTANIKKMLGLEGEIGAAKSNAGLGVAAGAITLAGLTAKGLKSGGSKAMAMASEYKNLGAEETLLRKAGPSANGSSIGGGVTPTSSSVASGSTAQGSGGRGVGIDPNNNAKLNKNHGVVGQDTRSNEAYSATSRARQIQGRRSQIRKEFLKGGLGGATAGIAGGAMAIGASVYGGTGAIGGAMLGSSMGATVGATVGGGASRLGAKTSQVAKDITYGKGIRHDGEQGEAFRDMTEGMTPKKSNESMGEFASRNVSQAKENFNYNRTLVKQGKELAKDEGYMNEMLGVDSNLSPEQQETERSAILKRNNLEHRGEFNSAHRVYARKTPRRNETPNINGPQQEQLTGKDDPTLLQSNDKTLLETRSAHMSNSNSVDNFNVPTEREVRPDGYVDSNIEALKSKIGSYDSTANGQATQQQIDMHSKIASGQQTVSVNKNIDVESTAPKVDVKTSVNKSSSSQAKEIQSAMAQLDLLNDYEEVLDDISDSIDMSSYGFVDVDEMSNNGQLS